MRRLFPSIILVLTAFLYVSSADMSAGESDSADSLTVSTRPKAALKTNIFYDATATVNLGLEVGLGKRVSLDVSGDIHPWTLPNGWMLTHYLVQPELRIWTKESFNGHFFALNAIGAKFNAGNIKNNIYFFGRDMSPLGRYRVEGVAYGAGAAYGYAFRVSRHVNLELELGLGYIRADFDAYRLGETETLYAQDSHIKYFGPTKGAFNVVILF